MINLLSLLMTQTNIIIVSVEAVLILGILVINILLGLSIKKSKQIKTQPYKYEEREVVKEEIISRHNKKKNKHNKEIVEATIQTEEKIVTEDIKLEETIVEEIKDDSIKEPIDEVKVEPIKEPSVVLNEKEDIIIQEQEHVFLSPETPMFDQVFYKKTEAPENELELDDDQAIEIEGKITFEKKLATTTMENKVLYNTLKNHILQYKNIKGRVVNGGEYFRFPGKQIIKIILIGKVMRMAIALDANDYDYNVYHQKDRSNMKKYSETPMFVKVGSRLGLLRATKLVDDCMELNGIKKKKVSDYQDYARKITDDVMLKEQAEGTYGTSVID